MIDLSLVIATSEEGDGEKADNGMTSQLVLSKTIEVPVAVGAPFPAIKKCGSACEIPGALRYMVEEESPTPMLTKAVINNGVKYMANMIIESGIRDKQLVVPCDWRAILSEIPHQTIPRHSCQR